MDRPESLCSRCGTAVMWHHFSDPLENMLTSQHCGDCCSGTSVAPHRASTWVTRAGPELPTLLGCSPTPLLAPQAITAPHHQLPGPLLATAQSPGAPCPPLLGLALRPPLAFGFWLSF